MLTLKELLNTMGDDFYTSYHKMFEEFIYERSFSGLRYTHDTENRVICIYDDHDTERDNPLVTMIYSFNEPKLFIENIPGNRTIRIIPDYKCLYQLIILAKAYRMGIDGLIKFYEL
jgi:hypothetical protein